MTSLQRAPFKAKPETVVAFTEGDCWHLAFELHRLTGYPMFFSSAWEEQPTGYFQWDHVGLSVGETHVLDVNGLTDVEDWMLYWQTASSIETAKSDEISGLLCDDIGGPLKRRYPKHNSRALARRLINHYDIPNTGRRQRNALPKG